MYIWVYIYIYTHTHTYNVLDHDSNPEVDKENSGFKKYSMAIMEHII